jgi:hypothetical protein
MAELGMGPQGRGEPPLYWTQPWTEFTYNANDPSAWWADAGRSEEELMQEDQGDGDDEGGADDDDDDDGDGADDEDGGDVDDDGDNSGGDDDGDEPEGSVAAAAVEIIECLDEMLDPNEQGGVSTRWKMFVPGVGWQYKRTICARFSDGTVNLSNDRGKRVAEAGSGSALANCTFVISSSKWEVYLGQEVAVLFEGDLVWLGRIIRMRRRYKQTRYVEYTLPVDLLEAKDGELDIFFALCWYNQKKAARSGRPVPGVYEYGELDTNEVHLSMIICPIALIYRPSESNYSLPADQQRVIDLAKEGCTEI